MKFKRAPRNQYWEIEFDTSTGKQTICIQSKTEAKAKDLAASYLEPNARLIKGGLG